MTPPPTPPWCAQSRLVSCQQNWSSGLASTLLFGEKVGVFCKFCNSCCLRHFYFESRHGNVPFSERFYPNIARIAKMQLSGWIDGSCYLKNICYTKHPFILNLPGNVTGKWRKERAVTFTKWACLSLSWSTHNFNEWMNKWMTSSTVDGHLVLFRGKLMVFVRNFVLLPFEWNLFGTTFRWYNIF